MVRLCALSSWFCSFLVRGISEERAMAPKCTKTSTDKISKEVSFHKDAFRKKRVRRQDAIRLCFTMFLSEQGLSKGDPRSLEA